MKFRWMLFLFLIAGCEIFPTNSAHNLTFETDKPPVFEFDYVNSGSFPGWVKFENHCTSIESYIWYLGINDDKGMEIISYSPSPKVQYPQNGIYRVIVQGKSKEGKQFEQTLLIEVSNY